jgi:hypothetical protein
VPKRHLPVASGQPAFCCWSLELTHTDTRFQNGSMPPPTMPQSGGICTRIPVCLVHLDHFPVNQPHISSRRSYERKGWRNHGRRGRCETFRMSSSKLKNQYIPSNSSVGGGSLGANCPSASYYMGGRGGGGTSGYLGCVFCDF